jgi:hypothetical protein
MLRRRGGGCNQRPRSENGVRCLAEEVELDVALAWESA